MNSVLLIILMENFQFVKSDDLYVFAAFLETVETLDFTKDAEAPEGSCSNGQTFWHESSVIRSKFFSPVAVKLLVVFNNLEVGTVEKFCWANRLLDNVWKIFPRYSEFVCSGVCLLSSNLFCYNLITRWFNYIFLPFFSTFWKMGRNVFEIIALHITLKR